MNSDLAILAMPKPFTGHIGVIQRNAITSWTRLRPRPEIIIFGTEAGAADCAGSLGLVHIAEVARNQYGTPLLADIFSQAEKSSASTLFAYVNADIILPASFTAGIEIVRKKFSQFLAVGRRTNLDVREPLDFSSNWEAPLLARMRREGELESHTGIDFFVFPRGTYVDVPPLAIGRVWFDQWCVKYARKRGIPVIDMTPFSPIVHQLHHYDHVAGGKQWVYAGPEADENLVYYASRPHAYTILSATHELQADGSIKRKLFRREALAAREWAWEMFVNKTHPLRKRLGLSRSAGLAADSKERGS
jgi:hypothetical protein